MQRALTKMRMLLSAKNIFFSYGKKEILKDISLDIKPSKLVLITGENGTGKTTLLKILAGLLSPQKGRVEASHASQLHMSADSLYGGLTVLENISLFQKLYKTKQNWKADLDLHFEITGLSQNFSSLSLGQKGIVSLYASFLYECPLYFLDEPTNGLDTKKRKTVLTFIDHLIQKGKTVVLTTHYPDDFLGLPFTSHHLEGGRFHVS